jgi:uncharacterized protein (TIGR00251 family)
MAASGCFRIGVKVVTNAASNKIVGWQGERLKIKLNAPPEGGRANKLLIEYLSHRLNLRKNSISIALGEKSTLKIVEIAGIDIDEFNERLKL